MKKILQNLEEKDRLLTEGFFRPEKSTYWIEEIDTLTKGFSKIKVLAKKYLIAVKKQKPDELEDVVFSVEVKIDPSIKNVVSKKKRGKTFMTLSLGDANGVLTSQKDRWLIGAVKLETKFRGELVPL